MAGESTFSHYVSLDLGSDSMAAYHEPVSPPGGRLVPLQAYASLYSDGTPQELLAENGKPSPRLRTRVFLREPLTSPDLPRDHTDIKFFSVGHGGQVVCEHGEVARSLFLFWRKDSSYPVMPNPKLIFQTGCQKAVPALRLVGPEQRRTQFAPSLLLEHLTVQVINNFVLISPPLREIRTSSIHLLLTIPNVYSLTHARQILAFVEDQIGFGRVSVVYESDALAYYPLDLSAAPSTTEFRTKVMKPEVRPELRVLTIDVGRGTTDLSLVRMERQRAGSRQRHTVLARTGVCSGGQALTYILTRYLNGRLHAVAQELGVKLGYDFTTPPDQGRFDQYATNRLVEEYVDLLKPQFTADLRLDWPPAKQRPHVAAIVASLTGLQLGSVPEATFRDRLCEALLLPVDLRNPSGRTVTLVGRLRAVVRRTPDPADVKYAHIRDLVARIDAYVDLNVTQMVDQLLDAAIQRERSQVHRGRTRHRHLRREHILDGEFTFVIVAGQAAQFAPIRAAIDEAFNGLLNPTHILFLEGEEAKTACCQGAVVFAREDPELVNPNEFFGAYGFCRATSAPGTRRFVPVNTQELLGPAGAVVNGLDQSAQYYFVYVVRPPSESDDEEEVRAQPPFDGFTAVLDVLRPSGPVTISYDPNDQLLTVNGKSITAVATHGYVHTDILEKVWPVVVNTE